MRVAMEDMARPTAEPAAMRLRGFPLSEGTVATEEAMIAAALAAEAAVAAGITAEAEAVPTRAEMGAEAEAAEVITPPKRCSPKPLTCRPEMEQFIFLVMNERESISIQRLPGKLKLRPPFSHLPVFHVF